MSHAAVPMRRGMQLEAVTMRRGMPLEAVTPEPEPELEVGGDEELGDDGAFDELEDAPHDDSEDSVDDAPPPPPDYHIGTFVGSGKWVFRAELPDKRPIGRLLWWRRTFKCFCYLHTRCSWTITGPPESGFPDQHDVAAWLASGLTVDNKDAHFECPLMVDDPRDFEVQEPDELEAQYTTDLGPGELEPDELEPGELEAQYTTELGPGELELGELEPDELEPDVIDPTELEVHDPSELEPDGFGVLDPSELETQHPTELGVLEDEPEEVSQRELAKVPHQPLGHPFGAAIRKRVREVCENDI